MTEPRRSRHLLDPEDLRGSHQRSIGDTTALTNVQRWVMSVLLVTTLLHFSAGIAIAAVLYDENGVGGRIVLNVLAALTGVLAIGAGRAIHGKQLLSPSCPASSALSSPSGRTGEPRPCVANLDA